MLLLSSSSPKRSEQEKGQSLTQALWLFSERVDFEGVLGGRYLPSEKVGLIEVECRIGEGGERDDKRAKRKRIRVAE